MTQMGVRNALSEPFFWKEAEDWPGGFAQRFHSILAGNVRIAEQVRQQFRAGMFKDSRHNRQGDVLPRWQPAGDSAHASYEDAGLLHDGGGSETAAFSQFMSVSLARLASSGDTSS